MANNVSEQSKSGVIMNPSEVAEWLDDYDTQQGLANEDISNQLRRQEEEKPMTDEKFDNRISLWAQEKNHENGPDLKGKGLVNGKEMVVSAWKNTSKSGRKYLGLRFEEPRDRGASTSNDNWDF